MSKPIYLLHLILCSSFLVVKQILLYFFPFSLFIPLTSCNRKNFRTINSKYQIRSDKSKSYQLVAGEIISTIHFPIINQKQGKYLCDLYQRRRYPISVTQSCNYIVMDPFMRLFDLVMRNIHLLMVILYYRKGTFKNIIVDTIESLI